MISIADLLDNDVVCGRSTVTHTHGGNKIFRSLIQELGFQYQSTPLRSFKKATTMEVIHIIQRRGGRFLKVAEKTSKHNPDTFEVADTEFIYEKCSHALRSYRPTRQLKRASRLKTTKEPKKEPQVLTASTPTPQTEYPTGVCASTFDALYETQQKIFRALQAEHGFNESSAVVTLNGEDQYHDCQSQASNLTTDDEFQRTADVQAWDQTHDEVTRSSVVSADDDASVFSLSAMDLTPFDLNECGLDDDEMSSCFFNVILDIEQV